MEWTPDLAVGLDLIDGQHKELFKRIGDLVKSVKTHECKYTIGDTLKFLEEYVHTHFGDEERMMKSSGFPEFDSHKAEHEHFVMKFTAFKDDVQKDPSSYTRSVLTNQVVVDWITSHIKRRDKAFGEYMRRKGQ